MSREVLEKIVPQAGIIRHNFSWETHAWHAARMKDARDIAATAGTPIMILQDLSGPRVQEEDGHKYGGHTDNLLTEKDLKDIDFGIEQNVDWIAMSYVGHAKDVENLRNELTKRGSSIRIIAKIERQEAVDNFKEILAVSDGVMVARGDLGNEVPLEKIPFIEREIIALCNEANKPVIVATQMMLSMTGCKTPTRAEVTDVAFAAICGADYTMLSEETASGKYPVEAVTMMRKILGEACQH